LAELKKTQPHAADPPAIFSGLPLDPGGRIRQGNAAAPYTTFCELRARRTLAALTAMSQAIKEAHPSCRLGAVVPADVVGDPIVGLRDAALDLDGLARLPLDALTMDFDPRAFALSRNLTRPQAYASMAALSAQLRQAAARPERAVVALRTQPAGGARLAPRWEIEETLARLLAAGPFGVALNPAPAAPVAPLLAAQPEAESR
jgi:hypothetical protein